MLIGSSATSRSRSVRDDPHCDVVGAQKPVHGDDAQLWIAGGYIRVRRALLWSLSEGNRRFAADGGRSHRVDGLRLAKRGAEHDRSVPYRSADLVPEAYGASYGR